MWRNTAQPRTAQINLALLACRVFLRGALFALQVLLAAELAVAGSGAPFTIQQQNGRYTLVNPEGRSFFSLGVCVVDQGTAPQAFNPHNPSYAGYKFYPDADSWAKATLHRLKSYGFTTIGGWSEFDVLRRCADTNIVFAPVLHIGSTAGAPWWDMWDQRIVDQMDKVGRDQILPFRDDPRILGYYTDNETGWWNALLFSATLEQASTSGQRQRLLELLRTTYRNSWNELMRDFDPAPGVESWADLERHGRLFLRAGGQGLRVQRHFLAMAAERYYSLVREIVHRYDSRALILGDRYPSFYYPEVVKAAAPYIDAISSNLNAAWNDGSIPRFYLSTLHQLSGKPIMIGEFYLAANENRTGNKNTKGIFPVVATQKDRARAVRNTLDTLFQQPYVIGADWFQYYDEPTHGRYDGENFNFGLIDIYNRPYHPLIDVFKDAEQLSSRRSLAAANAWSGVPRAPSDPTKNFRPMTALLDWDRQRGFVPAESAFPLADIYLAWNRESLFLGLYAHDVCEDVFYRGKLVGASDRAEWIVSIPGLEQISARLGAGIEPVIDHFLARITNTSGRNDNFRNIACLELPASLFRKRHFKPGDEVEFSSTFYTHARGYSTTWEGKFRLAR